LTLTKAKEKLVTLLQVKDHPQYLFLHVGGNDLKHAPIKRLKDVINNLFAFIKQAMPGVKIIWSEFFLGIGVMTHVPLYLPVSESIRWIAVKEVYEGFYLRHKNYPFNYINYLRDGVHLSPAGNLLFASNIKQGVFNFFRGEAILV
jgi:lysophospholipase L1-like esterase